ncbi:MAG: hypothetical protein JJ953_05410 [Gracilimonas sp.]|uniref:hypothetical protein n=1 Tax=Gracilimonas TaxID=649462 RepID=UPI001B13F6D8|nr:hypothetical protein [Gracilimonas sp.]MBO6585521.1 hypothetical protein [Gracilimonas sp.]MBO6616518.1 hypothetical protein [Gracilimonas sp.]
MKLLIILSIEEYADEVRRILVNQRIPIYSETEIQGCRCDNGKKTADLTNWFANVDTMVYSHLFFAFQNEESVDTILSEVDHYNRLNTEQQTNPLHAYQLNVEKSV